MTSMYCQHTESESDLAHVLSEEDDVNIGIRDNALSAQNSTTTGDRNTEWLLHRRRQDRRTAQVRFMFTVRG